VKALGLIPARGGSKVVPRKNVRPLAGKPLLQWTIEVALACPSLERVVVSTDDEEIAAIARACGAEVPFLRPAELAADDTPDFPVYRHALAELADRPEAVAWLRPTAPLRTADDMAAAIRLLDETGASCVRSVCPAEHHPSWMVRLAGDRIEPLDRNGSSQQRQALAPVYRLNGAIDVVRCAAVAADGPLFTGDIRASVMPPERSIDLDTELDFVLAEALLGR
jgi:CMP-N,N'-diacetyllegionaminic acid synthase